MSSEAYIGIPSLLPPPHRPFSGFDRAYFRELLAANKIMSMFALSTAGTAGHLASVKLLVEEGRLNPAGEDPRVPHTAVGSAANCGELEASTNALHDLPYHLI